MERFIDVNTQRLSENKYLCPLSGKKFKGPDFVLKHIFNKHMDKLEEARQEVCACVCVVHVCVHTICTTPRGGWNASRDQRFYMGNVHKNDKYESRGC